MLKPWILSLLVLTICGLPGLAPALTLSAEPDDCFSANPDDCIGGVYTLEVDSLGGDRYRATYVMDLTLGLEVPATTIEQIEFKVANGYQDPISIVLAPDAVANWSVVAGPLNGAGCGGNNDSFVCIDAGTGLAISPTTYTWQVDFTSAGGLLAEEDWHIGARFISPRHDRGWVLSASSQPIPEPSSYLMFGIGAVVVGFAVRRRAAA